MKVAGDKVAKVWAKLQKDPRLLASNEPLSILGVRSEGSVILSEQASGGSVSKTVVLGWVISLVGMGVWLYGYFVTGHPPLIDWPAHMPWWIADCFPNIEAEIGMAVMLVAMVPIYWPPRK